MSDWLVVLLVVGTLGLVPMAWLAGEILFAIGDLADWLDRREAERDAEAR